MLSLICFLGVLSVLVIVHELGHFIAAKRLGVRVDRFSFGFGTKLASVKKGETEYMLSAIPLGGYVKMAGDDPSDKLTGKKWEFLSRSAGDRFQIIFAGPLFNYVLAFLLFSVIFMFGTPTLTTEVGGLLKGYPAEMQNIKLGDKILAIDGTPVRFWEDMTELIRKHSEGPMKVSLERGGALMELSVTPMMRETKDIFGTKTRIALLGLTPSQRMEQVKYGFFESFSVAFKKLVQLTAMTYKALFSIVLGKMSIKESMTGPIGIFVITGKAAHMGLIYILHLMAILSASLAIFNLLPLPVLDGGHILFLAIEKLRGRPLSMRTQEVITNIGISFLILLMVFIFYADIMKFGIFDGVMKLFKK